MQQSPTVNVNNQVEVTAQETQSTSQSEGGQGYAKVRLPKLTMPRFKGELTKWNSFWDSLTLQFTKTTTYLQLTNSII